MGAESKQIMPLFQDRMKLQQVRLLVEVFTCEDLVQPSLHLSMPTPQNLQFCTSALSDVVTNSKSKECGPLQLHDINPNITCSQSESKIVILSFFKVSRNLLALAKQMHWWPNYLYDVVHY